jgi:hypothetical protein
VPLLLQKMRGYRRIDAAAQPHHHTLFAHGLILRTGRGTHPS